MESKRCTNSACRKTFSTAPERFFGECPYCGKEYPRVHAGCAASVKDSMTPSRVGTRRAASVERRKAQPVVPEGPAVELIGIWGSKVELAKAICEVSMISIRDAVRIIREASEKKSSRIPLRRDGAVAKQPQKKGAQTAKNSRLSSLFVVKLICDK